MGKDSKIEWTTHTFNPWIGCTKVSAGCKFCYAEADMDRRRKRVTWGPLAPRSVTSYTYWRQPLKWNKEAAGLDEKPRVFCASLSDIFESNDIQVVDAKGNPLWWPHNGNLSEIYKCLDVEQIPFFQAQTERGNNKLPLKIKNIRFFLFDIIERTQNLNWLLLTKRIENVMDMVPYHWRHSFPDNVWIGTSVENQEAADKRIPIISKIPAKIRFLSCEPLIGQVNLEKY